jgi:hypothetical protein
LRKINDSQKDLEINPFRALLHRTINMDRTQEVAGSSPASSIAWLLAWRPYLPKLRGKCSTDEPEQGTTRSQCHSKLLRSADGSEDAGVEALLD